ncbi:MAG: hypothetical protein AAGD07_06525 [Planctomycetota bacterium]
MSTSTSHTWLVKLTWLGRLALVGQLGLFTCLLTVLGSTRAAAADRFPFVIPGDDATPSATDRSGLLQGPIDPDAYVTVAGNRFEVPNSQGGTDRIRFWGMNLCFGANFPTHNEAERVAAHLAKLGCNAVRFHHMDMQDAPSGIWSRAQGRLREFDDEMVDRLDYFLDQLHRRGIYANLNLHVSRTLKPEEGFESLGNAPWWAASNKWVMYYDRAVQSQLKRYCRMLLDHRNPYRGNRRRADDAGIALIEMLNENYFSQKGYDLADKLPVQFQRSLQQRWQEWLRSTYGDDETLIQAWSTSGSERVAVINAESFSTSLGSWHVNGPEDAALPYKLGEPTGLREGPANAIRLMPVKTTEQDYAQQLQQTQLSVQADEPFTLRFWVRSDTPRQFKVEVSSVDGGQWRDLGLFSILDATPQWQLYERLVMPRETIDEAVGLSFSIGNDATPIEFAGIQLWRGGPDGSIPNEQSLAGSTLTIPSPSFPAKAHTDMQRFLLETEMEWVRELKSFLQNELGVKTPITASQLDYHAHRVNVELNDFVDLHNYWHHPEFPADANWSPDRWTVQNEPMESDPTRADWPANSLLTRMAWRVKDKPMTLSEWNYPEPAYASSGCVPMAAVLCGLQDWDGVFFFQYDQNEGTSTRTALARSPWFRDRTNSFFSFNAQPVKLALFSQFANVFVRGDLNPLASVRVAAPDAVFDARWAFAHRLQTQPGAAPYRLSNDETVPTARRLTTSSRFSEDQPTVQWVSDPATARGVIALRTPATRGLWGTIAEQSTMLGGVAVGIGKLEPNYGTVVLSSLDGRPLESATGFVVTVASSSENANMGFNKERTSVGRAWGSGPTRLAPMTCSVGLPSTQFAGAMCYCLDGRGRRKRSVPVRNEGDWLRIDLGAQHETLWYEVSVPR